MLSETIRSLMGLSAIGATLAGCAALGPTGGSSRGDDVQPTAVAQAQTSGNCADADSLQLPEGGSTARGRSNEADRETLADLPALQRSDADRSGHLRDVADTVRGLSLKGLAGGETRVIAYFTDGRFDADMTRAEFMRGGGYILAQTIPGRENLADVVVREIGELAKRVKVGPYEGAMTHGEEVAEALRPFHLWWSEPGSEWSVVAAVQDPADVLSFGRRIACRE